MKTIQEFLAQHVLTREEVDRFLDPNASNWGVFDAELGYTLKTCLVQDGIDGSHSIGTYMPEGERKVVNYAGAPCRINCYGNSFTQCQQVNDCETWEEYLAGHLGEPVRNFGVGGYGVYQSYRRMKRVEPGRKGVEYVILGVFGLDDHCRSLDAWRRPRCGTWFIERPGMFHANPWDHVRFDLDTGQLVERPNLCPTPESLYRLCDPEYVYDTFSDDVALNLCLGETPRAKPNLQPLRALAEVLRIPVDLNDPAKRHEEIRRLYLTAALRASMEIVTWAQAYAEAAGKKLMLLLTYDTPRLYDLCTGRPRSDEPFIQFLKERGILYADMWQAHEVDYRGFSLSPEAYIKRYCIGHYNPLGNHFTAYSIKDTVVDWLDPKPVTYPHRGVTMNFQGYLPGA